MKEILPPTPMDAASPRPWVFLVGAIDQGAAEDWQSLMTQQLQPLAGTVLNPRRRAWDSTWRQELDDPRFAGQVTWELEGLDSADVIACWLPANSKAPISLLELGLHARGGRLIVGVEPGFYRRGNVEAVCRRYAIPWVPSLTALAAAVRNAMSVYEHTHA